jgi:cell division protease FtsH
MKNNSSNSNKKKRRVELRFRLNLWRVAMFILMLLIFAPFFASLLDTQITGSQIELSAAIADVKEGKVENVEVEAERLTFIYKDGTEKITTKEPNISFAELLDRSGVDASSVKYRVVDQTVAKAMGEVLGVLLPLILMAAFFVFLLRSQNRGAQDIFSFGKSKAKIFAKGKQDVTFNDVAGVDDAKKELEEVVDFLKNPLKYRKIGARTPKGVLLVGPAGVGKTLLARAVAGEAGVPFFSMAGSEFMEMLVGVGASRVRDLFRQTKAQAPAIIFIDEIDAIGRQRGRSLMGGHDEREQTLNQILVEMDGFTPNDNVAVIAATNRGDLLDPALLRPGRFDRRVVLDMPDKEGRLSILKIHARGKKFVDSIKWEVVADRTVGFSGADLENMLNEAAIHAARADQKEILMSDIEEAATKVKLGPAKRKLQTEDDRRITAYHEAGHAIVTHFLQKTDPVHRISIVARGMSLGHTLIPPAHDRAHETKSRLLQQLSAMLGGRAAEELVFNEMTAGASSDISLATRIARAMVEDFGMSSLGPINMGSQSDEENDIPSWMDGKGVSQATKEKVDLEITKIMEVAHREATALIKKHRVSLDKVSKALLDKETLDRDEFEAIVGKKKNGVEEKISG